MRDPLADTHCHLCLEAFAGDLEAVLARAAEAGVERILVPGIDMATSRRAVQLAETHPILFAAVGLHPHGASDWSAAAYDELRSLARSPRVVAIGETGLDYYRDYAPRDRQRQAFDRQLELADELGLPVVVHSREAERDVLDHLSEWIRTNTGRPRERPGVLHAFGGDETAASSAAQAGLYIGVAGPVTYPSAVGLRRWIATLPQDRLLTETDAPYLPPTPHRGQRNEPAHVRLVGDAIASTLGVEPGLSRRVFWDNAAALFQWSDGTDNRHVL
ncbi:MAG TPA: TatD family hydrolase [Anaerolineales bacterium]|nr:TatD family hydrolase [Anaerolineales bacterium]